MPNALGKNGRVPTPPDDLIRPIIEDFVAKGYSNTKIVSRLCKHYDTDAYNVSIDLLKKRRSQWGLKSARGQAHTIASIGPAIKRVRARFPKQGSHDMRQTLIHEEKITVSRKLILHYMNLHHQADRSVYWTAGVNDIWVFDQHDKWCRFQLLLHVAIEPFSGRILWIKIWWTNCNPHLICGWYCDTVQALGAMPLVTQSDPGSENNGIANGFEDILEYGFTTGIYNPDDALERLVFHYKFIPWLQHELDLFAERFNHVKPHHNIHKILPHGRPNDIFYHAKEYDSCDFSVKVDHSSLDAMRQIYTPPDHPVFLLVPQEFSQQASLFMAELGSPLVTWDNVWNVYADLLMCFQSIERDEGIHKLLAAQLPLPGDGDNLIGSEDLPIWPGSDMGIEKGSDEESDDAELDFYEFDWTDDELL
ncbi:hypothetical protein BD769DRAFT_1626239 [Suillus cothurnatus]|nr:hypothetical protein BD769DRAFT_1626239 [Suillus cothurnatus]